jgi:hypothetical protein
LYRTNLYYSTFERTVNQYFGNCCMYILVVFALFATVCNTYYVEGMESVFLLRTPCFEEQVVKTSSDSTKVSSDRSSDKKTLEQETFEAYKQVLGNNLSLVMSKKNILLSPEKSVFSADGNYYACPGMQVSTNMSTVSWWKVNEKTGLEGGQEHEFEEGHFPYAFFNKNKLLSLGIIKNLVGHELRGFRLLANAIVLQIRDADSGKLEKKVSLLDAGAAETSIDHAHYNEVTNLLTYAIKQRYLNISCDWGFDKYVRKILIVDCESGKNVATFNEAAIYNFNEILWNAPGTLCAFVASSYIYFWQPKNQEREVTKFPQCDAKSYIRGAAFNKQGNRLALLTGDAYMTVWDVTHIEKLSKLYEFSDWRMFGPAKMAFMADGIRIIFVAPWDEYEDKENPKQKGHSHIVAFNGKGKEIFNKTIDVIVSTKMGVRTINAHSNHEMMVIGLENGNLLVWKKKA